MKTLTTHSFRTAALAVLLSALPVFSAATEPAVADSATRLLQSNGSVPVQRVGPYVERGTFRIQVATKLGRPDLELSDGTWLYQSRAVEGSSASGTLVIRFEKGRVSELAIAGPAAVAALRANPRKPLAAELIAAK